MLDRTRRQAWESHKRRYRAEEMRMGIDDVSAH